MPVPQTLAVGAFGLFTKWSASSMQTLRLPWPAPSPRTAEPSMYLLVDVQLGLPRESGRAEAKEAKKNKRRSLHL